MYSWKRFWCPENGSFRLADNGFLYDPDDDYGTAINPHLVPLAQVQGASCLVLLGEPGIGKSTAIEQEVLASKQKATTSGYVVLAINLGEYGDEARLIDDVFDSDEITNWRSGSHLLYLFLDSLDECRLQIPHVAKVLRRELGKLQPHLDRLRLRIACRTADWPASLTQCLKDLSGAPPEMLELVPLRRRDVEMAASETACDTQGFIDAVISARAQPLAIKPITLNFLLSRYQEVGRFPLTQTELYMEGCLKLCAEANLDRIDAKQKGKLSVELRLAIAKRIAAIMVFCNRTSVFRGADGGANSKELLTVSDLSGGTEKHGEQVFDVRTEEILEVLGTGLFSGRGHNGIGFAHQTYSEFLAASYLIARDIPFDQRMTLLRNADDSSGRIVPQLGETAAWLAGMDGKTFEEIMHCDPQFLMRSDVAKADEAERKRLVEMLLDLSAGDELTQAMIEDRTHYHKLNHEGLVEQLEPVIRDTSKGVTARRFAIAVAQECDQKKLQTLLADVATDLTDNYRVRVSAAYAVARIGDNETQLRLKPLALATSQGDQDFTIKTVALRTLWPKQITAVELFSSLEVPTSESYGTYRLFLTRELAQHLDAEQLPQALMWAAQLGEAALHEHSIKAIVREISLLGWIHFDKPHIPSAFSVFAMARLRFHQDIIPIDDQRFVDDEKRRRALAEMILVGGDSVEIRSTGLIYLSPRLLRTGDVLWMLDKVITETNPRIAELWVTLIEHLFDPSISGQLDALLTACSRSPTLDAHFTPILSPKSLDSVESTQLKTQHYKHVVWMRDLEDRRNPPPLDPPPAARIEKQLQACEAGNPDAWHWATWELQLESHSTNYTKDFELDLTTLPGWFNASPESRFRLVMGGLQYLTERSAGMDWLGTNSTPYSALAGYKALLLLCKESRAHFESLSSEVWAQWAPIVVAYYGVHSNGEVQERHDDIAQRCAENAPNAVSECLQRILSQQLADESLFILPQFVQRVWNEHIRQTLLATATDVKVHPKIAGRVLETLLEHSCKHAMVAARLLLSLPIPASGDDRLRSVLAAKTMFRHPDDTVWQAVWPAFQSDPAFGQTVVEAVAMEDMYNPTIVFSLSEADSAKLYLWLTEAYPPEMDRKREGAHIVGPREAVAAYRDAVLRAIQNRGTKEAVAAVQMIAYERPQFEWMKWVIAEAKRVMLRTTWRPLTPTELLELTRQPNSQLVQTAAQLQDAILESLAILQVALQDETPAAPDLWDGMTPKDENHLSDYIKRHLQRDLTSRGIVALREVEIRRGEGSGTGERTDIHVTGIVRGAIEGSYDQVRVIIEVKGSWHEELETAMTSQLVDRYLRDNQCQNGIYVVGWYMCAQWDKSSSSYKKSRKEDFDTVKQRLIEQAMGLSNDSRRIRAVVLNAALR